MISAIKNIYKYPYTTPKRLYQRIEELIKIQDIETLKREEQSFHEVLEHLEWLSNYVNFEHWQPMYSQLLQIHRDLLHSIEMALFRVQKQVSHIAESLPASEYSDEQFRHELVDLMVLSVKYWEETTQKSKIELAEKSQLWGVYCDKGVYGTRTMDKYLDYSRLPRKPRWKNVLQTAYFVLNNCPPHPIRHQLEFRATRLQAQMISKDLP